MTLGGLAVVLAFMAAVVLLALVVVVAASWSQLEARRGGADRLGRLLATGMTRVEHLLARARRALADAGRRLAPLLARGLAAVASRTQGLADRLGGRPAQPNAGPDAVRGRRAAEGEDGRGAVRTGRRDRAGGAVPARGGVDERDRLPDSFRDRLAG
ncbi:hypothetical protein WDZ17_08690 [Pseudokineococcus basanitobsidens]|uniref:Uncharacterized protein n=1 Tax=Pseudokineococcus basanitobsidens TaxID=1926649 RepID=A0ABU8RJV1_9ACTN